MKIAREPRNPVRTRERLLQAAFHQVYRSGFNNTDLDAILTAAGVTKGALYHHFKNKEALGYAVVDEVIGGITRDKWLLPLQKAEDPIQALIHIIQSTSHKREDIECGCPLNNLAQEMSPLDEEFRKRLAKLFNDWHDSIARALRSGQKRGFVRRDVDPGETATFIIAAYEGHLSIAKTSRNPRVLQSGKRTMVRFLESLREAEGYVDQTGRSVAATTNGGCPRSLQENRAGQSGVSQGGVGPGESRSRSRPREDKTAGTTT